MTSPISSKVSGYPFSKKALTAPPQSEGKREADAAPADPLLGRPQKASQAETAFRTQQIAQRAAVAGTASAEESAESESPAVTAFLEYMAKSPEERYFEAFLKSKGMTQEDFDDLPPEDKKALMKEFEEYVKQSVENDSAEKVARTSRSELL